MPLSHAGEVVIWLGELVRGLYRFVRRWARERRQIRRGDW